MDIQLKNKSHYDLMEQFERLKPGRVDRENKELWSKGYVYCDGIVDEMFIWFRRGVAYGVAEMLREN